MELRGEVLNVVDYGAFVDVGLKDSGLVHISQIANRYIKSPYEVVSVGDVVSVWVVEVDADRKRVRLSMIPPGQERRPPERAERPPQPRREDRPPPPRREDRPPPPPRPAQQQPAGQRPGFVPRPGGGPTGTKPFGPKPGPKPRGPGAPGWRTSPKPPPPPQTPEEKAAAAAAKATPGEAPPPPPPPAPKKPAKPKAVPQLSDQQKAGKMPVNSFAQLAQLLRPKEDAPPPAEEPKPDAPPAG
jgi:predicted RNA-binding protein with RPS1 domain